MDKRIYITHCSAKKDVSLRNSGRRVTPDILYIAAPLQRFIQRCKEKKVEWAIFSDKYGVVFPFDRIEWYDKHPNKVTDEEFQELVANFMRHLSHFDEIWFYYNPGRFHPLYQALIDKVRKRGAQVILFSHISEIE
jgi:hypothetical protein